MKRQINKSIFIIVAGLFLLTACAEVPLTHRKGLRLLPNSELISLSLQQYGEILKKSRLSADQNRVGMVRSVGEKIARSAEAFLKESGRGNLLQNYKWEFNLIQDDKMVNAWCMPGGKVAVYTGILPYTRDETGLAVVLGHEIAHAIADHGNERMSQALLANMGGTALSVAVSKKSAQTRELFITAFGVGTGVGFLLPYSRLHENEADRIGLTLMARAGYNPNEAVPFWSRMNAKKEARPPEFLSTHPAPESRMSNIRRYIPEAMPYYQGAKK